MVVPERAAGRAEARAALASQFWEVPVSSSRSLAGAVAATPGEPPPLAAQTPQGAERAQQLLILQAGVGPVAPGYDGDNGGVVSRGGERDEGFACAVAVARAPPTTTAPPSPSPVCRPHRGRRRGAPRGGGRPGGLGGGGPPPAGPGARPAPAGGAGGGGGGAV